MRPDRRRPDPASIDAEIFWSCVEIAGQDECWPWIGSVRADGYGTFYVRGVQLLSHRVSWALHHGRWPDEGRVIRLRCDNGMCANPLHGEDVDRAEHARTVAARARDNGFSSRAIALALTEGASPEELVSIFGMDLGTAQEYHALGPVGTLERRAQRGVRVPKAKRDRRRSKRHSQAWDAARDGRSPADLMAAYGLTRATAYRYVAAARSRA